MALTPQEIQQWVTDKVMSARLATWNSQNDISYWRGLHHKYDQQLLDAVELYKNKGQRLIQLYKEHLDEIQGLITITDVSTINLKEDLAGLKDKILRLAEKWWAVKYEIEGRQKGFFKRAPVGTSYYIDLTAGNDANDGLAIGTPWLTLTKYTTTTVRTAGDIAYVRANTSETRTASIVFDEDGTAVSYIQIVGCDSVTNDPWSDASDVKPIETYGDAAYWAEAGGDEFWKIERLVFKESSSANGNFYISANSNKWYLKSCEFTDNSNASGIGLTLKDSSDILVESCDFKDNLSMNVKCVESVLLAKFKSCTFNGGVTTTDYGLYATYGSVVELDGCQFGQTTAHDLYDLRYAYGGKITARNCKFTITPDVFGFGDIILCEDYNQTYGDHRIFNHVGNITKDTGVVRSGGASSSAKMEPNANCGANAPLTLHNDSLVDSAFKIWCSAAATTVTIYIRSLGAWGTYPTNTQLYCEASYLSHATLATRTTVASTQVLSDGTTWVAFTMTFTPLQAGFAYVNVFLKLYEASKGCYVDVKPIIS